MGNTNTKRSNTIKYKQSSGEEKEEQVDITSLNLSSRNVIKIELNPSLEFLRFLNLSFNSITHLPDVFHFVPNLYSFNISGNKISNLPTSMSCLNQLIEIVAEDNHFETFPEVILSLYKLQKLNLSRNRIKYLPPPVGKLKRLSTIRVNFTEVEYLPMELLLLPYIKQVELDGCPILNKSVSIPRGSAIPSFEGGRIPPLKELAARKIITDPNTHQNLEKDPSFPESLKSYVQNKQTCSFCNGPFFQHHLKKFRVLDKWGKKIPFVYHLCRSHFDSEKDRIFQMFKPKSSCYQPSFYSSPDVICFSAQKAKRKALHF